MDGEPEVRFRPRKRLRFLRKKFDDDDDDESEVSAAASASASDPTSASALVSASPDAETVPSIAEILRMRKLNARKPRKGIVASSVGSSNNGKSDGVAHTESEEQAQEAGLSLPKQFVPQTGVVVDSLDKHMMAEERAGATRAKQQSNDTTTADTTTTTTKTTTANQQRTDSYGEFPRERAPAGAGKLQEVDLGPDVTQRNIELTEAATRAMRGEPPAEIPWDKQGVYGRFREGGIENPHWRKRKQRTTENLKRDALVEEILRENRLPMYTPAIDTSVKPSSATSTADNANADDPNADEAEDDLIAEKFRRDFMDSLASRARPPAAASSGAGGAGGKGDDKPRGPKLGGSRSARAAMRAAEEKKERFGARRR